MCSLWYKKRYLPLVASVLICHVAFAGIQATAQEARTNIEGTEIEKHVRTEQGNSGHQLVDPLANARGATVYVGRAINRKGQVSSGFYHTEEIEYYEQATGFLYAYPVRNAHKRMKVIESTESTQRRILWNGIWVVTCKHCVEGKSKIGVRINTMDGSTRTYLSMENEWTTHPTMDVAVAKIPLSREPLIDLVYFERSHAVGRPGMELNQLTEGIRIAIVGYPIGMIGEGNANYPVVREGYIGQIQGYLANDPHHRHFLVAGSVFPGNSGGPVVVPAGLQKPGGMTLVRTLLIGMVSAQKLAPAETTDGSPRKVLQSADLAKVIPVDVINQTIESSTEWRRGGY